MEKNSILISSSRSGTNYFLSVYSQCFPQDIVTYEIFRPTGDSFPKLKAYLGLDKDEILNLVGSDPLSLWRKIEEKSAEEGCSALAKIFYYHVGAGNPLWSHFRSRNRVIHLIRRNALDVFVSLKVAHQTGKWQEFGKERRLADVEPMIIDRAELTAFIDKRRAHIEHVRQFFGDSDYSEVFYEDIAASTDDCIYQICTILGKPVPKHSILIDLRRQKMKENKDIIANFDEVAEFDAFSW